MFCKRQGIELVAEQLLASGEGLFTVTLVVIHCNDLTVMVLKMYKAAAVLSALMKMYAIPCHNRDHINVMLVLQSSTDSLHIPQGLSKSRATSSGGACNLSNVEVEEHIVVIEEADTGIKQEIPEDISFPDIKAEPDEVSYVCVSVIRHTLPVSSTVSCCCDVNITGHLKQFHMWE